MTHSRGGQYNQLIKVASFVGDLPFAGCHAQHTNVMCRSLRWVGVTHSRGGQYNQPIQVALFVGNLPSAGRHVQHTNVACLIRADRAGLLRFGVRSCVLGLHLKENLRSVWFLYQSGLKG